MTVRSNGLARPGSDAWAFFGFDGKPLTAYLAWLHFETQQIRKWTRVNWVYGDTSKKPSRVAHRSALREDRL